MDIASLCHREVVAVVAAASLQEAAMLMGEEHVEALVVVNDEDPPRVVGILTDRDLALDVIGKGDFGKDLCAGHVAKAPAVGVRAAAGLQEAVAVMEKEGVRRLLVVDDDGGVVGLVSGEDLMAAMAEELAALARALRRGIARESGERPCVLKEAGPWPVFPCLGAAAP